MCNLRGILIFLGLFTYLSNVSFAQKTTKTVPLRGIIIQGDFLKDTYFYGTKKLNSAYDLTIPFLEIEDKEVDRLYKSHKTINSLRMIATFLPGIYLTYTLSGSNRSAYSDEVGWTLLGVSVVSSVGLGILSRVKMRKAINRYNELILNDASPQSFRAMPNPNLINIAWCHRF